MRKRLGVMLLSLLLVLGLCTGCGGEKEQSTTETAAVKEETTEEETGDEIHTASIFIGKSGDYGRYSWNYKGELTPRKLIRGIEKTTGWNLTLNKRVTKRKDGYIICFSDKSVLYTGQKTDKESEFYIPYKQHFYQSVLDSIAKTLRYHFKEDGKVCNIYYWGKEDTELKIKELNLTFPKDEPYKSTEIFKKVLVEEQKNQSIYEVEGTFLGMKDSEHIKMKIDGSEQTYRVTYRALLAVFRTSPSGEKMKIRIREDKKSKEKLVIKIW